MCCSHLVLQFLTTLCPSPRHWLWNLQYLGLSCTVFQFVSIWICHSHSTNHENKTKQTNNTNNIQPQRDTVFSSVKEDLSLWSSDGFLFSLAGWYGLIVSSLQFTLYILFFCSTVLRKVKTASSWYIAKTCYHVPIEYVLGNHFASTLSHFFLASLSRSCLIMIEFRKTQSESLDNVSVWAMNGEVVIQLIEDMVITLWKYN